MEKVGGGSWGEKVEFGGEKRASRIFRLMKIDVLRSIFNLERSKKYDIGEKGPKMAEKLFGKILVEPGNLSNLANWIKNHCFYMVFYR